MMSDGVPVPPAFFTDILPRVEDLPELKLILYVMYVSAQKRQPAVSLTDLTSPGILRNIVGSGSPEPGEERLHRAAERAVASGRLLRFGVRDAEHSETYLLLATDYNRELVERLGRGDQAADDVAISSDAQVAIFRPNVFALYEHHIGPLTPLVAEQLRDAERSYPRAWLEQAILAAVQYNKRNWRYILTILTRWEQAGGPDGAARTRLR